MVTEQITETDPAYILADLNSRIRILENKQNTLTERLLIVNQNMIEEYKKLIKELKILSQDMTQSKGDIDHVHEVIKNIVKDMSVFAKKEEIKILEKYMNMWDIFNFVTDDQLNERLKDYPKKKGVGE